MKRVMAIYVEVLGMLSRVHSPFLLAVREYWDRWFAQTGLSKLHCIARIRAFFAHLNSPFPAFNAQFIAGLEFLGRILLTLGLGTRLIGFLMAANIWVAYWPADREAPVSIFFDPGNFYVANPSTFLFASSIVLIFCAHYLSSEYSIARCFKEQA